MSIPTFTVTVLISYFFTFSNARTPLLLPENDVIHRRPSNSLPESDTKPTILLPSQKPSSSAPLINSMPLDADNQPIDPAVHIPESDDTKATLSRPVAVVSFRPISRQFRLKRPYPVHFAHKHHHHHHRCRHKSKAMSESGDLDPVMFRSSGVRQIPEWFVRFHQQNRQYHAARPRLAFKNHRMFEKERERSKTVELEKGRQEKKQSGFMKRIRKFLFTPSF